jgi:RNA polymerase sigma factor (sigma-70 family)
MQPGADEQSSGAAGYGIERKSARGVDASVPTGWLDEFTGSSEDRELEETMQALRRRERLAEDADLVTWLALNGFAGTDYDRFAYELARYGHAVITAWVRRGLIFGKCRDRGLGGLEEPPPGAMTRPDVAEELANETVAKSLHYFRENVLMRGQWNPNRGASIKSYFIGQCLIRFPNIYRAWLRTEASTNVMLVDDLAIVDRPAGEGAITDPADLAVIRQEIDTRLANLPERTRSIMVLTAAGWSQQEIAVRLGTTVKAVERTLNYYRPAATPRKGIA